MTLRISIDYFTVRANKKQRMLAPNFGVSGCLPLPAKVYSLSNTNENKLEHILSHSPLIPTTISWYNTITINEHEVRNLFRRAGPDGVSASTLRHLADQLSSVFTHFLTHSSGFLSLPLPVLRQTIIVPIQG